MYLLYFNKNINNNMLLATGSAFGLQPHPLTNNPKPKFSLQRFSTSPLHSNFALLQIWKCFNFTFTQTILYHKNAHLGVVMDSSYLIWTQLYNRT